MGGNSDLERFYSGDEAWADFANVFKGELNQCKFRDDLVKIMGDDEQLAEVVYASVGDISMTWVCESIPALSGLSPVQCIQSPRTIQRLREMLMRMPR